MKSGVLVLKMVSGAGGSLRIPERLMYQDAPPDQRSSEVLESIWDYCKGVNSARLAGKLLTGISGLAAHMVDDGCMLSSWAVR